VQESTTIARPYANAAFEYAVESNSLDTWSAALDLLGAIASDSSMDSAIKDPKVSNEQLLDIVSSVGGDALKSKEITNFIKILIENERLQYAPEMTRLYEDLLADKKGAIEVLVTSAHELGNDESAKIADAMKKRLGKEVEITSSVDSSLIGGAIIKAGDMVIDTSLRGRLQKLTNDFI